MKGISMRRLIIVLFALLLSACGFQLRGSYSLPWDTIYIAGLTEFDPLRAQIKRSIEAATQTKVVTDPKQAQATLAILGNVPLRNILSLNAAGLVREIQLTRAFSYKVQNAEGKELLPLNQILLQREMTFDDARLFAKEAEETMIIKEMEQDLVQQLMRRLAASSRSLSK